MSFVRDAATDDEPFFLQLSFVAPHTGRPHGDDTSPISSPFVQRTYRDTYAGPPTPEDPSYDEANVSDKNPEIRRRHRLSDEQKATGSELLAQRRESLRSVDDQIARVVGELAAVGELDNTYLLLTSDNGVVLGEHRLPAGKPHLYDPTALVPLLMRGPRVPPGSTVSALTAQTDIAPTLLKLARLSVAPYDLGRVVDGRNLMPTLQGDAPGRPILLEGHSPVTPTEPGEWIHHGLATERFTYLYFPRWDFEELYDRRNDRYQRSNVAGDEEYAAILDRMRDLWEHYRWCVGERVQKRHLAYIPLVTTLVRFAKRQPSAVLLAVQLASLLVFPFTEDTGDRSGSVQRGGHRRARGRGLGHRRSPAWTSVSIVLAVPATAILLVEAFTDVPGLLVWSEALLAALYFYTAGALIAYLLADEVITRDELYGVGATFTVVAWGFRPPVQLVPGGLRRTASPPPSTRASRDRGWSCCSSASPRCPAPGSATSSRSARSPGRW